MSAEGFDWRARAPADRGVELAKLWRRIKRPVDRFFARRARRRVGTLIGITGSVGKSTATRLLAAMLRPYGSVAEGVGFNTDYRVLKSLRKLPQQPDHIDVLVQEVAAYAPGYMARIVKTVPFDAAIVTTIGTDHMAAFGNDIDKIAMEKAELPKGVVPAGFVCLNLDDPRVAAMAAQTRARVVTYGRSEAAQVRAVDIETRWPHGLSFTLVLPGGRHRVTTRLVSSIYLPSVLGALAAVHGLGHEMGPALAALAVTTGYPNRMEPLRGKSGTVYLLDTVKASWWSTVLLLKHLDELEIPDLVVVLGQVSDFKNDASRNIRKMLRETAARGYTMIGVGGASGSAKKVANEGFDKVLGFETREEVVAYLRTRPPSVVLLKGGDIFDLNTIAAADEAVPFDFTVA